MAASRAPAAAAATDGGMEENAMAILDSCGIKDSHDLHEDRAAFLEAVRSACFAADSPSAPSWRMYDGVFQILQKCNSLDLAVASFHLLIELGKSWLPFLLGNGAVSSEIGGNARSSDHLFDPAKFLLLVEMMVEPSNAADDENGIKAAKNMMILQYLVNTLEADFVPRHVAYKESLDWVIFRESLLNILLGSRKLVFKSFVKNCIYLLINQYHHEAKDAVEDSIPSGGEAKSASDIDSSLNYSSLESERTLVSLRKLFVMVMKLDSIRKEADTLGLTSRADGVRNPIMEVILDELTYNISYLSPFLLAFVEWKWKLEIILQYFSKYCGKGPVRTRRSDNSQQDLKLDSVLSSFLTATSAKGIVKKMGAEVAQLLLSHAYQVCLSVQDDSSDSTATSEKIGATLGEISGNLIFAFQNLSKVSPNIPISPFEKQALFTAATLTRKLKKVGR
ncbi:hypothetical protein BS78_K298300 [Paspalum vaginatum]|uniref:Uncharacterized protein n=1 Tax=Paspalum vaginatum TaxID=158149 RepID=A0A9W8CGJ5_9POAL|nr:hypothetical protein BS78_K298300 [Paspalum vaginatum]